MRLLYSALTAIFLASLAVTAQASAQDPVINGDQSSGTAADGTLSYNGDGGPLTGESVTFDILTGKSTPQNSGLDDHLDCGPNRCQLNFKTGDNKLEGNAKNGRWTFDAGGNFTLTGTVMDQSGHTIASGTLLSGSFSGTPTVSGGEGMLNFSGFGTDTQNQKLSAYFGIGQNATFKFSNTDIVAQDADIDGDGSLSGDINNGDLTNTAGSSVAEPGVLSIFGLAVLLLGGLISLRRKHYF